MHAACSQQSKETGHGRALALLLLLLLCGAGHSKKTAAKNLENKKLMLLWTG